MNELKLKISNSDFSNFAGFYYTDEAFEKHNEVLNEYIRLYKSNEKIRYFQVECDRNVSMHTIAYICYKVDEKHFIRTDFEDDLKDYKYRLCFYKEDNKQ